MSMDREKLYTYSLKRLVELVYYRLERSSNLSEDWRTEAMEILDGMREELIDWLIVSHKEMQKVESHNKYLRKKEREKRDAPKDL